MKFNLTYSLLLLGIAFSFVACNNNKAVEKINDKKILKGLYVYGPEMKSFTDCNEGREYWVTDSSNTLELSYAEFNFEKPYEPVYVEFECKIVASDADRIEGDLDSTVVVTKLIKISKTIPDGPCAH